MSASPLLKSCLQNTQRNMNHKVAARNDASTDKLLGDCATILSFRLALHSRAATIEVLLGWYCQPHIKVVLAPYTREVRFYYHQDANELQFPAPITARFVPLLREYVRLVDSVGLGDKDYFVRGVECLQNVNSAEFAEWLCARDVSLLMDMFTSVEVKRAYTVNRAYVPSLVKIASEAGASFDWTPARPGEKIDLRNCDIGVFNVVFPSPTLAKKCDDYIENI